MPAVSTGASWPSAVVAGTAPATTGWVTGSAALVAVRAPGAGSRNSIRTRGGAAMNSTIIDWMIITMSMGTPVSVCMVTPPARRAPNSRPAPNTPIGLERPSRATVMASKPKESATSGFSIFSVPETRLMPASPDSPPETAIAMMYMRFTDTPAVRAASGLAPTARSWKPMVERCMSHQAKTVARMATTKLQFRRKESPNSGGNRADSGRKAETGLVDPSRCSTGVYRR